VVLAGSFREAVDARDGHDPNDKARYRNAEDAGPAYGLLCCQPSFPPSRGIDPPWAAEEDLHFESWLVSYFWLGFVATVQFTGALFMKQSMKLFAINTVTSWSATS